MIIVKLFFKDFKTFLKSIYTYFSTDFDERNSTKEWERKNDSDHKIHIIYWFAFAIIGLNIIVYIIFIDTDLLNRN